MSSSLVGVHVIGEADINQANQKSDVLGVIRLTDVNVNLKNVRELMAHELPTFHRDFLFLTQERIPVLKHQEEHISAIDVLNGTNALFVTRNFDRWRIGIKKAGGSVIGFIFADRNLSVTDLRSEINEQLLDGEFAFCDRNGWPVLSNQEQALFAWDVICQGVVTIQLPQNKVTTPLHLRGSKDCRKRKKHSTGFTIQEFSKKDIVISYARSEADEHARKLKAQLEVLGAQVFLDQDDIVPGDDWQNKLNDAIQNCTIFVPLVTARYGNTTYTNKEVKLADYIGKFVIPVNFMKSWPPNHLAIQFASIQYIDWRKAHEVQQGARESDNEEEEGIRTWESRSVERVANDIYSILRQCKEQVVFSNAINSRALVAQADSATPLLCPDHRPFIVISAHPQDKDFCGRLQCLLERNCYEAWCSLDSLATPSGPSGAGGASSPSSAGTITPSTPLPSSVPTFGSQDSRGTSDSQNMGHSAPRPPPLLRIPSFQFSCSMDTVDSDSMSNKESNRKYEFRKQVLRAEVVIIVLSESYLESKASQQQACYCLLRKKVVVVGCTEKEVPVSIQKRLQFATIVNKESDDWECQLLERISRLLKQPEKPVFDATLEEATYLEKKLLTELPQSDYRVYVTGGTHLTCKRSESICCAIGQELASLKFVSLCTSGFFGVEEQVARSFCEERSLTEKPFHRVFHVVPERDKKDWSKKAYQRPNGTFGGITHGQVKVVGGSMAERDAVIARVFDVCIVIEGGLNTARRVAEFVWNDKPVIPIVSTGRAAAGNFNPGVGVDTNALNAIWENPPPGVDCNTWAVLKNSCSTAEDIGKAVKKIIINLHRHLKAKKRPTELPEVLRKVSRPS
ncbi:uncharacterized protein LOC119170210 isoform X2 [Rhipicephalus microplus]|uniref:uncharacterized protein LOC119170210 isoform X2 n=1 Tax=Rhipicephalus microplus TaxID=6941 RepID=UPI003F6A694D